MNKYIITWVIISTTMAACPDAKKKNEFGIVSGYSMTCAVAHFESTLTTETKEILDREEAFLFYNNGLSLQREAVFGLGGRISEIKIDSVLVK